MIELNFVRRTTWACVGQFEGETLAGLPVHVRHRHGELSVRVADEVIFDEDFGNRDDFDAEWDEIECVAGLRCLGPVYDPANKTNAKLRLATCDDAADIARLFRRVRTECLSYLPTLHSPDEDVTYFEEISRSCRVVVAEAGSLVGFCAARPGWIDHLYVDPVFQGRGIGTKLLRVALNGEDEAELWVFKRNAKAVRFYEHFGFITVEQTDGARNEEKEPDLRMHWRRRLT